MALFFISDLHLRGDEEPKARAFAAFLASAPAPGDIVVFGGDIFDLFVGDKAFFREAFRKSLDAIESAVVRGAKIYFLEGNHDFHVRGALASVEVRADEFALEWGGGKIWICHGDEINRRDYGYLFLRCITRNSLFRAFLKFVPGAWIAAIGGWSSGVSREYSDVARADGDRVERTRAMFREYAGAKVREGYDLVLIGHSHIADNFRIAGADGREGAYINLGFATAGMPFLRLESARGARQVGIYAPPAKS